MPQPPTPTDLMWIQEAIVTYRHSREWFNARIREGTLEKVGLPGDAKVYLRRDQLARLLQKSHEQ